VWEPPFSPSTYDSNSETKNSIITHDFVSPNNDDDASENYVLDMLYDNALDDGPMILDDPPCLAIATTVCEDNYDTLIHESLILSLNSPNHTIEEKYARVEST
jgi:hypothetical protein